MNYSEAVAFLFEQLPMFHRVGAAAYKPDIGNIQALCNSLGNPENKFKSIHVAGTNGKGSTASLIASALKEAGYKVGLFTSPHLMDFRERIRINGEKISKETIVEFVIQTKEQWTQIQPSFFEITTALAFHYFASEEVDIAIIEVGMGGRLDSTNIIKPELSIITSIGKDHMQFLGSTIPLIAKEKAGIIKNNTPVILGEIEQDALNVIEEIAREKNTLCTHSSFMNAPKSQLEGIYQVHNERTAFAALMQLKNLHWNVTEESIKLGFQNVLFNSKLRGRWEIIQNNPTVVAEVAHNEEGIQMLIKKIETLQFQSLRIILGMVEDKDHSAIFNLLPTNARYYFCASKIPRAFSSSSLQAAAAEFHLQGIAYESVEEALNQARVDSHQNDLILITGSIFTVAEILPPDD
jgi:dihydrofolate synthase/folylpolyglutamate synthase